VSLLNRLPGAFAKRDRLRHCEEALGRREDGRRVLENFETSLDRALITTDQFERFCSRLSEILPDPPHDCDSGAVEAQIDRPEPFYCLGPPLGVDPGTRLSGVMDVRAFLYARYGPRRFTATDYDDWRGRFRRGQAGGTHRLTLRGRRPFFWMTRTDSLPPAGGADSDRLRDLLGLRNVPPEFLVEARFSASPLTRVHRPTVLDALDNPTFYREVGADGWGVTDDLSGPRPDPRRSGGRLRRGDGGVSGRSSRSVEARTSQDLRG
jgi:hypothetical protein